MAIKLSTFLEDRLGSAKETWWKDDQFSLVSVPPGTRDAYLNVVRGQLPWIDRWASQNLMASYNWYSTDMKDVVVDLAVCISRGGLLQPHRLDKLCADAAATGGAQVTPSSSGQKITDSTMYNNRLGANWGGIGIKLITRAISGKPRYWPNGSLLGYDPDPRTYSVVVTGDSTLWGAPLGRAAWSQDWLATGDYWPLQWSLTATNLVKKEMVPCSPSAEPVTKFPNQTEVISAPSLVERLEVHRAGKRTVAFNLAKASTFVTYMRVIAGRLSGADLAKFNDQMEKLSVAPNRVFGIFLNDGHNPFELFPTKHPLRKNATAIWEMRGVAEGVDFDKLHTNFDATVGSWVPIVIGDEDGLEQLGDAVTETVEFKEDGLTPGTYVASGGLVETYPTLDAALAAARVWYKRGGEVRYGSLNVSDQLRMDATLLEPTLHGLNEELEGWEQIVQAYIGSLISLPNADNTKVMLAALGPVVVG